MQPWGLDREVEKVKEPTAAQLAGSRYGLSLLLQKPTPGDTSWNVWISLHGNHPILDPCGFIVGQGQSRDEAVGEAVKALEEAIERLQSPPGVVFEEERRTL